MPGGNDQGVTITNQMKRKQRIKFYNVRQDGSGVFIDDLYSDLFKKLLLN